MEFDFTPVIDYFPTLLKGVGVTLLIVTHEMAFARDVSDWAMFMDGGVVVEANTPDHLFSHPDQERTQHFLRKHLGAQA
ncbi:hypothetical protein [Halomonas sp.]|uniref:hypothetical protein n=1 Tax=Halomonas sp. TaxID=1486246 RepID=UPI00262BEF4C|nr:hypothetical protein [Halomonas sp.]